MAWYDNAIFYHIYPLGLSGCSKENKGECESHFDKLNEWAAHAASIGCNAIYIGPLFESEGHGYETVDYRRVDRRLGTNDDFKDFVKRCHNMERIENTHFRRTYVNEFAFKAFTEERIFIFGVKNKDFRVIGSKVCKKCFCCKRLTRTRLTNNHHITVYAFSVTLKKVNKHRIFVVAKINATRVLQSTRNKWEHCCQTCGWNTANGVFDVVIG